MRSERAQTIALLLLGLHLSFSTATPILSLFGPTNTTSLQERGDCAACGTNGSTCCYSDEVCYTDQGNGQASCSAAPPQITAPPLLEKYCESCEDGNGGGGSWVYWVSTFTSTDLVTYCETYSSYIAPTSVWVAPVTSTWVAPVTTAAALNCDTYNGECACGNICCASDQYCEWEGQCAAKGGYYATSAAQTWYATSAPQTWYQSSYVESYTAPLRPTSISTETITPTTTVGFEPAVTTGTSVTISSTQSSSGLSGGAIAGIVIGVIAGLIILILIIMCCCVGAGINGCLAFFGLGNRRNSTKRTEEVEYYNRHGSRADGRTWYGASRPPPSKSKNNGNGIGWAGVLAALAAFAAALGLARRSQKKREEEKSQYSSDYSSYSYSDATRSSDRRTRDTRRSRR